LSILSRMKLYNYHYFQYFLSKHTYMFVSLYYNIIKWEKCCELTFLEIQRLREKNFNIYVFWLEFLIVNLIKPIS
jgi:hypothetical protein